MHSLKTFVPMDQYFPDGAKAERYLYASCLADLFFEYLHVLVVAFEVVEDIISDLSGATLEPLLHLAARPVEFEAIDHQLIVLIFVLCEE